MTTTLPILLTASQRGQIEAAGVAEFPNECCGIIYGRDIPGVGRVVEELETVKNASETGEQYHRFSISGQTLINAEKKCGNGQLVLGFYHSHPDHPARPSEFDRQHAWPFYSYVIVSIHQHTAKDMTCWVLDEKTEQFAEQSISVA